MGLSWFVLNVVVISMASGFIRINGLHGHFVFSRSILDATLADFVSAKTSDDIQDKQVSLVTCLLVSSICNTPTRLAYLKHLPIAKHRHEILA